MSYDDPLHTEHPARATFIGVVLCVVGMLVAFFQFARVDLYTPLRSTSLYSGQEDAGYWKILRRAYLRGDPSTLFLSDRHLNDWALGVFSEGSFQAKKSSFYSAWPQAPIFKIKSDKMTILVPINVSFFGMEPGEPLLLQAQGTFKKETPLTDGPARFVFVPRSLMLGAAVLPDWEWIRSFFVTSISHVFTNTKEYRELNPVWLKMTSVRVSGDRLTLSRPEPSSKD